MAKEKTAGGPKVTATKRDDVTGVDDQYYFTVTREDGTEYIFQGRTSSLQRDRAQMVKRIELGEGGPLQESAERMLASIDNRLAAIEAAG
jgi:hypothetical protein